MASVLATTFGDHQGIMTTGNDKKIKRYVVVPFILFLRCDWRTINELIMVEVLNCAY